MRLHLVRPVEARTAVFALEHLDVEVPPLVVLAVPVRDEGLGAELALERSLAGVGPNVMLQGRFMLQNLLACSERALVW